MLSAMQLCRPSSFSLSCEQPPDCVGVPALLSQYQQASSLHHTAQTGQESAATASTKSPASTWRACICSLSPPSQPLERCCSCCSSCQRWRPWTYTAREDSMRLVQASRRKSAAWSNFAALTCQMPASMGCCHAPCQRWSTYSTSMSVSMRCPDQCPRCLPGYQACRYWICLAVG